MFVKYGGEEGLKRAINLGRIRQINNGYVDNGAMVRVDIFRHVINHKFYAVPVYAFDFAKGILPNKAVVGGKDKDGKKDWLEMDVNFEFCFSLFKDDLITIYAKNIKDEVVCYYSGLDISNGVITVINQNNAAPSSDDEKKVFNEMKNNVHQGRLGIQNLLKFKKLQVDALGKISEAQFQSRQPAKMKTSHKEVKEV